MCLASARFFCIHMCNVWYEDTVYYIISSHVGIRQLNELKICPDLKVAAETETGNSFIISYIWKQIRYYSYFHVECHRWIQIDWVLKYVIWCVHGSAGRVRMMNHLWPERKKPYICELQWERSAWCSGTISLHATSWNLYTPRWGIHYALWECGLFAVILHTSHVQMVFFVEYSLRTVVSVSS